MNLLIAQDHRFSRLPDGSVWTTLSCSRSFFERYLAVFTSVSVLARVEKTASVPETARRVDGEGVNVLPVVHYVGPKEYIRNFRRLRSDIRRAAKPEGAVILRASSQIGNALEPHLRSVGHPYGLEIVGDPYDTFSPGAVRHPLRPFFRWWFTRILRRQCARAAATAYVTAQALQKRYPPGPDKFTTHYSSIELHPEAFAPRPRPQPAPGRPLRILMVGTIQELYKAPDVLIRAFAMCRNRGLNAELVLAGGGRQMPMLKRLASEIGVSGCTHFLGPVPGGAPVREQLDAADLFVLPSRQEGLPRAVIEAMARALPCISTTVGGIPELLEPEYLVPPNEVEALADKIWSLATNPPRMESASARNLEKAKEYSEEILAKRRLAFYSHLRQLTAEWISAGKRRSIRARPVESMRPESPAGGPR
ncbi:MAG: glycosyltransferase family 4 protein [Acidobacteriaceae bacterium]|nr:glycosyltransferase family 4 protein [Acidobacteriaceae bacterium]MBV9782133.1 glycosyltransferase family 4 protein [Acidobacteriaceae bacterium]